VIDLVVSNEISLLDGLDSRQSYYQMRRRQWQSGSTSNRRHDKVVESCSLFEHLLPMQMAEDINLTVSKLIPAMMKTFFVVHVGAGGW
jgi:hypothetical protein